MRKQESKMLVSALAALCVAGMTVPSSAEPAQGRGGADVKVQRDAGSDRSGGANGKVERSGDGDRSDRGDRKGEYTDRGGDRGRADGDRDSRRAEVVRGRDRDNSWKKPGYRDRVVSHGRRYAWGPGVSFYFADGYYYGECNWVKRRAIETGSRMWWRRYERCRDFS